MKKVVSLVMAAILLVGAVCVFSSCTARPEMDLTKAKENLEKAGYRVDHIEEKDLLSASTKEVLLAEGEEDNYLQIYVFENVSVAKTYYDMIKTQSQSYTAELQAELKHWEATLKAHREDFSETEIADLERKIEEIQEDLEAEKNSFVVGRNGKTVWYGTQEAIEATKG